jgi:trehalose 6-phosphate phosphatase
MSRSELPPPIDERMSRIRETLANAAELLVCLDFDGTLAPIVEDPDAAEPTDGNRAALESLAETPAVTTAIVSGRALADVRDRVDGPSIYAGNHGLEIGREGSVDVHPTARERAVLIDRICAVLDVALASVPNLRIENKRLTGTVHLRSLPAAAEPIVRRTTRRVVDRIGGDALEISTGKRILEIGPDVRWDKGEAVASIAADHPPETAVIYVGDDVTDESAFRAVEPEGIGVRVGGDDPSNASCRVESPAAVASFLSWLATTGIELVEATEPRGFDRA